MKKISKRKSDPALVWEYLLASPQRSRGSLATQLATSLIDAIHSKQIPEGVRLPSSRAIADSLNVGRNTAITAINSLIDQGYLVSRSRSGVFVATGIRSDQAETRPRDQEIGFDWDTRLGLTASNDDERTDAVEPKITHNFIYGQFDLSTFPINHWRQCERSASGLLEIADWGRDMFDRDDAALIESLRRHILPKHGIWAEPDEILITLGGQEGRYLVSQLLCRSGDVVGIEDPGLPDVHAMLAATPARQVSLPMDDCGVRLSAELKRCDVAFITPGHQCPTTAVMPLERRRALLAVARRRNLILVEDTYETEVLSHRKMIPSLKSLDTEGRVIHIGSLSKSLAPGLRIGFVVASKRVIDELRAIRRLIHRHPPGTIQRSLSMFIDRGYYHSCIRQISTMAASRAKIMGQSLHQRLPGARIQHSEGAASFWVELPEGVDARELRANLRRDGVLVEAGNRFFTSEQPRGYLRLAVSQVSTDKIDAGVRKIAEAIHR